MSIKNGGWALAGCFVFAGALWLGLPSTVLAQGCPPNAHVYKTERRGGDIVHRCKCNEGYVKSHGECITRAEQLRRTRARWALELAALAEIAERNGHLSLTVRLWEAYTRLKPDEVIGWMFLAGNLRRLGEYERAEQAYKEAISRGGRRRMLEKRIAEMHRERDLRPKQKVQDSLVGLIYRLGPSGQAPGIGEAGPIIGVTRPIEAFEAILAVDRKIDSLEQQYQQERDPSKKVELLKDQTQALEEHIKLEREYLDYLRRSLEETPSEKYHDKYNQVNEIGDEVKRNLYSARALKRLKEFEKMEHEGILR